MRTFPILILASALLLSPLAVHAHGEASPSLLKPRVTRAVFTDKSKASSVDEQERARLLLTVLWLASETPHKVR